MGRQSIAGELRDKLERPIHHVSGLGRKPEYPEKTHMNTGRTCKLHTDRPEAGIEPRTLEL
ncbi:UNVERIFIED_CONTAM: hypothetical protein FKN15_029523 [Acipenser sinensis]